MYSIICFLNKKREIKNMFKVEERFVDLEDKEVNISIKEYESREVFEKELDDEYNDVEKDDYGYKVDGDVFFIEYVVV